MRTALITGGSSGMGLEYARQLLSKGYRTVLVSNRQDQLEQAVLALKEGRADEGCVITHWEDLSTINAAELLHEWCKREGLEIDILVCNAGMFFFKELSARDMGKADTMLNLHVKTNTDLCLLFGEDMKRRGKGSIILMSSMAAIATPLYKIKPFLMKLGVRTGIIHTPQWLVRKALRASAHGRRIIRPSAMNWYLPGMVALLPAPVEKILWKKLK